MGDGDKYNGTLGMGLAPLIGRYSDLRNIEGSWKINVDVFRPSVAPQNAETLTAGAKYKKFPIPILTFLSVCGTYANSADPD